MRGRPIASGADAKFVLDLNRQEGQMHSSLIAVVLCFLAQASAACISTADDTHQGAGPIKAHIVKARSAGAAVPGELITTAAAGTRNARTATRAAPLAAAQPNEEPPRRAGPAAMMLAALALMSGIALRRYGAGSQ
jgi:hypothetical protein